MPLNLVFPSSSCSLFHSSPGASDRYMNRDLIPYQSVSSFLTPDSSYFHIEQVPEGQKGQRKKNGAPAIRCVLTAPTMETTVDRRSGNYQPTRWDYDFVQSLKSPYMHHRRALSRLPFSTSFSITVAPLPLPLTPSPCPSPPPAPSPCISPPSRSLPLSLCLLPERESAPWFVQTGLPRLEKTRIRVARFRYEAQGISFIRCKTPRRRSSAPRVADDKPYRVRDERREFVVDGFSHALPSVTIATVRMIQQLSSNTTFCSSKRTVSSLCQFLQRTPSI
ncbi:Geraniol synthase, chloroplastic [Cinnamomum micranthum f. kanehirae]|uniref:Geraniol synthase, chloroplastic n=1 Tax=Cinnamomum micranthum f. kanehirae TaxID=337451 RepID=A0A3S3MGX0_9MAGN|nr:Geraniol synthase, chloroplastic [Cinnamomum micranthum f. kanehirae]